MIKKTLKIIIFILLIILICMLIYKYKNENSMDLVSGDNGDHWFHLRGTILEKKDDTLLVELDKSTENTKFFNSEQISLDCSKYSVSLDSFFVDDNIIFYFFKYNIDENNVKVEKIIH